MTQETGVNNVAGKAGNSNLSSSRSDKADEFYTQLSLIESELNTTRDISKGKPYSVIATILTKATFSNTLQ